MSGVLDLRVSMLLTARLCHDLSGPVAAVGNGVEMLDDPDPEFAREALRLAAESAAEAASRLQFYRFAYGIGETGAAPDEAPAEVAIRFFSATPIGCDYAASARRLPPAGQKLACNLLLVAADGLPRGGRLVVSAGGGGFAVDAVGDGAALPAELAAALTAAVPPADLTPRSVQAYFAGLLAEAQGLRLQAAPAGPGRLRIAAVRG